MAEQLVDPLHAIDVEHDQRRGVARRLDGALGELVEVAPVGQPGQGVDVDQVAQLALRREQVGDAALVVHDERELRHQERDHRRREQGAERSVRHRDERAEVGEIDGQPGELDDRGADQRQAQRAQRRAARKVLEARHGGGDVQGQPERGHGVHLRVGRDVVGHAPRRQRRQHRDGEGDAIGPFGDARPAARVEAADAAQHDDRPLQGEQGGDRGGDAAAGGLARDRLGRPGRRRRAGRTRGSCTAGSTRRPAHWRPG